MYSLFLLILGGVVICCIYGDKLNVVNSIGIFNFVWIGY